MDNISSSLLAWFDRVALKYPWRGETNVYFIWLSEVMLQQTQVETVKPFYLNWLKKFPTCETVANASEDEVLKAWEGLGYYARARNFHKACITICDQFNGIIPREPEEFLKLKGVGDYMLSAVQSIAFQKPVPAIDGNVKRILSRLLLIGNDENNITKKIKTYLQKEINIDRPGDFNQALMDFGRIICKPNNPKCSECPIQDNCIAYAQDLTREYPVKIKKPQKPHYQIAVGIVWKADKILVAKRKSKGLLGGLWEFPGGKINHRESPGECVEREINEELGITVESKSKIAKIKHSYTHFSITMQAFNCQYIRGTPSTIGCSDYRWITKNDFSSLAFPKANHKIFDQTPVSNPFKC